MKKVTFTLLVALGLAVVLIPAYVIQPFRYQSPEALRLALWLRTWAPAATLGAAIAAAVLGTQLLRGRLRQKLLVTLGLLLVLGSVALARYNYFERVFFRPISSPQFGPAAEAQLDADEMVMAVRIGPEARAYPIRAMAYHHLVNDTLGGVPLVATY